MGVEVRQKGPDGRVYEREVDLASEGLFSAQNVMLDVDQLTEPGMDLTTVAGPLIRLGFRLLVLVAFGEETYPPARAEMDNV